MNVVLPARYDELVHRLAIGIEPLDALTGRRITTPLRVTIDLRDVVAPRRGRLLEQHASGRFALRYGALAGGPVVVRIDDPSRRHVARCLSYPVVSDQAMRALEAAGAPGALRRGRRPVLLPGAAHPLPGAGTSLRGRLTRDGRPVRWARIAARATGSGAPLGSAHSDDRGEFLLVIGTDAGNLAELVSPLAVTLTAIGPDPPVPAPASDAADPLADLPIEIAQPAGVVDDVSSGTRLPAGYEPGRRTTRQIALPLGKATSMPTPLQLTP
jgi:hypothetical protein